MTMANKETFNLDFLDRVFFKSSLGKTETVGKRSILDVLVSISSDREMARYMFDKNLAAVKNREFNRLKREAFKRGYSQNEVMEADFKGKIEACIEAKDEMSERLYRVCMADLQKGGRPV